MPSVETRKLLEQSDGSRTVANVSRKQRLWVQVTVAWLFNKTMFLTLPDARQTGVWAGQLPDISGRIARRPAGSRRGRCSTPTLVGAGT